MTNIAPQRGQEPTAVRGIPQEWEVVRLGQLYSERKEKGLAGLPVMSVTLDRGLVLRSSLERRVESELKPADHALVREGDLVYNMMRMWQGASGVASVDCVVSPAYVVAKPNEWLLPAFAGYLLKAPQIIRLLYSYSQGITRDRLRLYFDNFVEVPIPLPSLPEQRKIAAILSGVDDAIAATRKVIEQTKRVKQGLLQTLMTRGIGHARFNKTEIGEIPEGWWVEEVQGIADVAYGVTVNQQRRQSTDRAPLLTVAAHDPEEGWRREGVSEIGVVQGDREKYSAEAGDVLLVEGNGNPELLGWPQIWDGRIPGALHQNHLIRVRPRTVEPEWIALGLSSAVGRRQIRVNAKSSSGLYTINSTVVKQVRLPVAPTGERRQIIEVEDTHSRAISHSSSALAGLARLKQGLLQDLLTGRVRVPVD